MPCRTVVLALLPQASARRHGTHTLNAWTNRLLVAIFEPCAAPLGDDTFFPMNVCTLSQHNPWPCREHKKAEAERLAAEAAAAAAAAAAADDATAADDAKVVAEAEGAPPPAVLVEPVAA